MAKILKKDLELENKLLREKLESLQNSNTNINEVELTDISMTKLIKVVSLYNGILNLKTSNGSDATVFSFNFFGYEQPIFYSDLIKCVINQRRFFTEGFCMILDSQVVKLHYLEKDYNKILSKEGFINFLNMDEESMMSKYEIIPVQQRITLLETIAYKINDNEFVDRNKVDMLAKISKVDIYELANKLK
jgi:hypothetical protein